MIKVGILGTGFGKKHGEIYSQLSNFQVVQIFGRDRQKLDNVAGELNIKAAYSIEEVLDNPEVDLVDICLPTEIHKTWVIEALKRGKDVFCETPVALNLKEALEIQEAAKTYGKTVFVDLFTKFSTPHQKAIELVKDGALGVVESFFCYNKTPPIWGDLGLNQSLLNFCIHNFDFVTEILGTPNAIKSSAADWPQRSAIHLLLQYNGTTAGIQCLSNLPENSPFCVGFEIIGLKGSVAFDGRYGEESREFFTINVDSTYQEHDLTMKDDYEEVIKHVGDCLRQGEKSDRLDISHAVDSLRLMDMVQESLLS